MIVCVGSGYLTACVAMMVGPEGRAVGVEHIPELATASIENIKRSVASHLLNDGSLSIHVAGMFSLNCWLIHVLSSLKCQKNLLYL